METVFNTNADFINKLYGASKAPQPKPNALNCSQGRNQIPRDYLSSTLSDKSRIKDHINNPQKSLPYQIRKDFNEIIKITKEENKDVFAALGFILSHCPKAFGKFFRSFTNHIQTLPRAKLVGAGYGGIDGISRCPLEEIVQNGIDSATHLLEAVLKSILNQSGEDMKVEQFKKAFQHSKKLLIELTQIPLNALVDLESYLFKRPPGISGGNCPEAMQIKERLGRDVKSDAITYDPEKGANLNQNFLENDIDYMQRVKNTKADSNRLKVYGCPGIQAIPYFFDFIEKVFEQYLYPNFDELMKLTRFERS